MPIEKAEKCCKIKNFGCYQHPGRSTAKTRLTKGVDKRHIVPSLTVEKVKSARKPLFKA